MIRSIFAILFLAVPLHAQQVGTIEVNYASMLITKARVGLWYAARNDNPGSVTWSDGSVSVFRHVQIPDTPVRGILIRAVDKCVARGKSDDGCVLTLNLPREPVRLVNGRITAVQITATGTLTKQDGTVRGTVYRVVGVFPASATTRINRRTRIADAVVFTGIVTKR